MNERIYSFQSDSLGDYIAAKILIDSKKLPESVDSLLSLQLDKFVYDTYYFGRLKNFSVLYCEYEYGEGLLIINKKNYQISNCKLLVASEGDGNDGSFLNLLKYKNRYQQILVEGTIDEEEDNDKFKIDKLVCNDLVIGKDSFELKNFVERKAKKVVNINKPYVEYK